jgi:hydrogenase nickel incorporation protein HypA/HybF
MHEISICRNILDIVLDQAETDGFSRVARIGLEIGPFAGVEIEALRFGFDAVTKGSIAEGARLDIHETQATARCTNCGASIAILQRFDPCPHCGSHSLQITGGEDLKVKELEVT